MNSVVVVNMLSVELLTYALLRYDRVVGDQADLLFARTEGTMHVLLCTSMFVARGAQTYRVRCVLHRNDGQWSS